MLKSISFSSIITVSQVSFSIYFSILINMSNKFQSKLKASVPYLTASNVCDNGQTTEEAGWIQSPNYPNTQSNINNCAFTVKTANNVQRIFTLYSIETTLHNPSNNQE